MKRSIVLNAADEAFVAQIPLASTVVKHTLQLNPGDYLGQSRPVHYVNLESLQPGLNVGNTVIDYFLMLLEEQSRNGAVCFAGTIPRIGVLPSFFATSSEVLDYTSLDQRYDQSIRRRDWLGWCAAKNCVLNSFCLDLIMFPVCSHLSLYALGVINCRKRCIQVYHTLDNPSYPNIDAHMLSIVRTRCSYVAIYVQLEARGYAPCTDYDEVWELEMLYPGEQTVLQGNGNVYHEEIGVSLCMHAYHLAFGLVPDFTREAFPGFRRRMVRDLLVPS